VAGMGDQRLARGSESGRRSEVCAQGGPKDLEGVSTGVVKDVSLRRTLGTLLDKIMHLHLGTRSGTIRARLETGVQTS